MKISLLILKNTPIYHQLEIEEALLRADKNNWCIINIGSPKAIVLGISGKEEELVDLKKAKKNNLLLIKRFSGGGTVIVDEDTLFSSFIFQKDTFSFPAFPEHILRWSAEFYKEALRLEGFSLKENDYTLDDKKCAGNAQYIKKDRWLHHTTFLYDFKKSNMDYLLYPKKTPTYRMGRDHTEFLCKLNPYFPSKETFIDLIYHQLKKTFQITLYNYNQIIPVLNLCHRKTLKKISF